MATLRQFLKDWGRGNFLPDIGSENFMQDEQRHILAIDPFIHVDLWDAFMGEKGIEWRLENDEGSMAYETRHSP